MKKSYKLTQTQIKFFWKRVLFWANFFGIDKCWEIHTDTVAEDNCYASIGASFADGLALFKLCTSWDKKVTNAGLDKVAFHECAHLLLFPVTDNETNSIGNEHMIIRTLENQVWTRISEYGN